MSKNKTVKFVLTLITYLIAGYLTGTFVGWLVGLFPQVFMFIGGLTLIALMWIGFKHLINWIEGIRKVGR